MSWMEALLLECQVAVQDFSSVVEMLVKEKFTKVSNCHCTVSMHVNTYITFKGIDSFNLSRMTDVVCMYLALTNLSYVISFIALAGVL